MAHHRRRLAEAAGAALRKPRAASAGEQIRPARGILGYLRTRCLNSPENGVPPIVAEISPSRSPSAASLSSPPLKRDDWPLGSPSCGSAFSVICAAAGLVSVSVTDSAAIGDAFFALPSRM